MSSQEVDLSEFDDIFGADVEVDMGGEAIDIDLGDIQALPQPDIQVDVADIIPAEAGGEIASTDFIDKAKEYCGKKHGNPGDSPQLDAMMVDFCEKLNANKVSKAREAFLKLPEIIQCMFLYYAYNIITNQGKFPQQTQKTAFYMIKMFQPKDMRTREIYSRYINLPLLKAKYEEARQKFTNRTPGGAAGAGGGKKKPSGPRQPPSGKYDKTYQRKAEPDENDPLYLFYTSLYSENPESRMAIRYLTEYGVFSGDRRKELEEKYKKLYEAGKLIR